MDGLDPSRRVRRDFGPSAADRWRWRPSRPSSNGTISRSTFISRRCCRRVFFGGGSGSLLLTLGGFAIAYLMRPLGALFFSHIGDRRGRRHMMLLSVAMMTAAMLATALLPTRAAIGPAAGWLLLLLRCVMGFSVGGEYTGVVAYLLEGAPPERRGLIASSASAASEVGALLAVGVSGADGQPRWAQPTSKLGLANSVLRRRGACRRACGSPARRCTKSPNSGVSRREGTVPAEPLRSCAEAPSRRHRARASPSRRLGSITYYVGITYVPAFLTSAGALARTQRAVAVDDRRGRRDPGHAAGRLVVRPDRAPARPARSVLPAARSCR